MDEARGLPGSRERCAVLSCPLMTLAGQRAVSARRGRRKAVFVAVSVVFALTPWLSLGYGTPVVFLIAAIVFSHQRRAHALVLWISAECYAAVVAVGVILSTVHHPQYGGSVLLIGTVGGTVQALFTIWGAWRLGDWLGPSVHASSACATGQA